MNDLATTTGPGMKWDKLLETGSIFLNKLKTEPSASLESINNEAQLLREQLKNENTNSGERLCNGEENLQNSGEIKIN